ncbi:putative Ornithine cyclodeaminase, Siderophore biosynthesis protein SbnB [Nitrospina gracilis 3/211]|uniref:Putative Ornithine cyclodeaminase, Siderophore biosynthesis protein SbnB n=1 Tax=Nitrospina gracilis (strain 3/211) TaxID=1266370 RepID=M1YZK7_NITG3|nr:MULTISPECIES: 2,3-diaminopropionate biosynthesis protein SbnB [Nitrospina]MCF8723600.1 ornithine cyclodeaminase [Nitrospina sp. Nb-3]CCQ90680.1 putative Ornithine cyclodeaminase, Siderophore biosynthesis protein SbnB [Nitrospina gracilis 3/211]
MTQQVQNLVVEDTTPKVLYLSRSDLTSLGGGRSAIYMQALTEGLRLHARQEFVQPLKPYLRWPGAGHIADRIIAMPGYLGGGAPVAGIKWVGSRHQNPGLHHLERASALTILNHPDTNYPMAVMEGGLISGMRTAAVTAVAARHLAREGFASIAIIGCGPIGRMQLTTLLEQFPSITDVHLFDLNVSAVRALIKEVSVEHGDVRFFIADSAEAAVRAGDVVAPCTVTDKPYIPFEWLRTGSFVSNVSIMDVHKEVFLQVDKVVVDDWDQCNREKKVINQLVMEGRFSREQLHAELGEIVEGRRPGRETEEEIILLNPMGMAIDDLACAHALYQQALSTGIGTWLKLY